MRPSIFLLAICLGIVPAAQAQLTWTQQCGPGPQSGYYAQMVYDSAHGQIVLFGGVPDPNNPVYPNDTWTWDGNTWTKQSPANKPPGRAGFGMAYDSARGRVVIFGGSSTNGFLNDTWEWDGTNWTPKANGPGFLLHVGMAYDAARQQTVLYGGSVGTPFPLANTWVWDGTAWTQKFPATNPGPRSNFRMTYDAAQQQIFMFGGWNGSTEVNETWVWDGTNWTPKFPANPPSPRQDFGIAYDSNRQRVVLFSGILPPSVPADDITYEWDGTNWAQDTPAQNPAGNGRGGVSMAYDAARGQVVLFGGADSTHIFTDTWVFGAPISTTCPSGPPPTITSVSPTSGTQGQTIGNFTVNGSNFQVGATLSFNPPDVAVNATPPPAISQTQIIAGITIASGASTGVHDVIVTNPDGQRGTLASALTVVPVAHTLAVASTNPATSVPITVSPSDNNGLSNGTTQFTLTYNGSAVVSLNAPSTASVNNFSNWTGCDSTSGTTCTVTMTMDRTVTANYATPLPPSFRPALFVNGHKLAGPELDNVLFVATKVVPQLPGNRAERIRLASVATWWGLREGVFGLPDVGSKNAFAFSLCDAPMRTHLGPLQVCPTGVAWQVGLAAAFVPNFTEQEVLDKVQIIWPTRTVTDVLAEATQTAGFDPTGTTGGAIVASTGALQESWLLRHTVVGMTLEQPIITGRCVQPAVPPRDCIGVQPGNPDSKLYAATKEDMLRSISDLVAIFDAISP